MLEIEIVTTNTHPAFGINRNDLSRCPWARTFLFRSHKWYHITQRTIRIASHDQRGRCSREEMLKTREALSTIRKVNEKHSTQRPSCIRQNEGCIDLWSHRRSLQYSCSLETFVQSPTWPFATYIIIIFLLLLTMTTDEETRTQKGVEELYIQFSSIRNTRPLSTWTKSCVTKLLQGAWRDNFKHSLCIAKDVVRQA